jgi:predicted permease
MKRKVTSLAAILSLALAIGACTSAFRLVDALLLRPLPVAEPERLYSLWRHEIFFDGTPQTFDGWAYPAFRLMRAAVKDQAELIAISYAERTDLTYGSDDETEKAHVQYVSGWMFNSLELQPALGRLFTERDDLTPGAHPYAVISYDYWTRRFGRDPMAIRRTFRMGNDLFEIAGVAPESFTGTEPGTMIDIFVPTMMNHSVERADSTWIRTIARLRPGVAIEPVREKLNATSLAFERERAKSFAGMSKQSIDNWLKQTVFLEPAAAGVSGLQSDYRLSLAALGVLVAMVLLIACANVANLMTAQAAARAREMALRVSIGAGRWRLVQLVLVESWWLAFFAAVAGGLFAWWSAPFVVSRINPADNPARLFLPADWRVFGFGLALAIGVTFLFGLAPALRASAVKPASALKGGEDPHSRRRLMHTLIAAQVAFCFLVLFVAGLLTTTFERLANLPTGFSSDRLLTLQTVTERPQRPVVWEQVAEHLRALPGVETVALAAVPLLSGFASNNGVSINGAPPSDVLAYFLDVSPGWLDAMRIPLLDGRDFNVGDANPGAAIVSAAFANEFFHGENPVGKAFEEASDDGKRTSFRIVGLVRDARYRDLRGPMLPVAYLPFHGVDTTEFGMVRRATFIVRTATPNPLAMAPTLRREVARASPGFRVSNIRTQLEINLAQTVRERLLAMLALFFAIVALVLAGVGLYGVLDYSVLQRRREIAIRMALGAKAGDVAWRVMAEVLWMVLMGASGGLALGLASVRYIESLLYQVRATDMTMLAVPTLTVLAAALVAAVPALIRAVRIDPVTILRAE